MTVTERQKIWRRAGTLGVSVYAAYLLGQSGLLPWLSPFSPVEPTLLMLCMESSDVGGNLTHLHHCSSSPLELKTSDECGRAMTYTSWMLTAAQRLSVATQDLTLACVPKEDIRDRRPTPVRQKPIAG
jgi:hypothetical protein